MDWEERDTLLKERRLNRACRLRLDSAGPHQFGGRRDDVEFLGVQLEKPIHHFLTLATADPLCPFESEVFERLPLFYPLLYGAGGGEIQYSVLSDTQIQVHHLCECYPDDPYVEHDELPLSRASLQPLSYAEDRLLCAFAGSFTRKLSAADNRVLANCDGGSPWRVGGYFRTVQGVVWALCKNPACTWKGEDGDIKSQLWPIAKIWASKAQLGDIWGQFTEDVEFFFGYCPHCCAIHAENRCS